MGKKKTFFGQSLINNQDSRLLYFYQLAELAISSFKWKGLPEEIDERFLELTLFENGHAVFIEDEVMGPMVLCSANRGPFDVNGIPLTRDAYSPYNNYHRTVGQSDSVLCFNNVLRFPGMPIAQHFADILYDIDMTIRVNARAQKTPVLLTGSEKQQLVLKNLYQKWDGNQPVIFGDSDLSVKELKVLKTDAPFVGDRLYNLKFQFLREAMTYLGIPTVNSLKKERQITTEVENDQGGTLAYRYSRLKMRQKCCKELKRIFGWDVSVGFEDMSDLYATVLGGDPFEPVHDTD